MDDGIRGQGGWEEREGIDKGVGGKVAAGRRPMKPTKKKQKAEQRKRGYT